MRSLNDNLQKQIFVYWTSRLITLPFFFVLSLQIRQRFNLCTLWKTLDKENLLSKFPSRKDMATCNTIPQRIVYPLQTKEKTGEFLSWQAEIPTLKALESDQKENLQRKKSKEKKATKNAKAKEKEDKETKTEKEKKSKEAKTAKDKKETKEKEKEKTEKKAPNVCFTLQILSSLEESRSQRKQISVPRWAKIWICKVRLRHKLLYQGQKENLPSDSRLCYNQWFK